MHQQTLLPSKSRLTHILSLGLPIMGGMLAQSFMNVVDAAMVGTLGETALAGVGIGGYAVFITISFVIGLSASVQTLVARRRGEGSPETAAIPLNGGLLIALGITVPLSFIFIYFAPEIIGLLNQDPEVVLIGTSYLQLRTWGFFAIALNFCYRGYWNGMHRSIVYMRILIFIQVANIAISYVLIFGKLGFPAYGTDGAAMGTSLALILGMLIYSIQTFKVARPNGFLNGLPDKASILSLVKLAIPFSMQQVLYATGISVLFMLVGMIGTDALAVGHVLINLELLLIMPAVGLGMAATTLVSHAIGRDDMQDAYLWAWQVTLSACVFLFLLGLPLVIWPQAILGIFIHDPVLLELGIVPLRIAAILLSLGAIGIVLNQALIGAGANKLMLKISVAMQWGFLLPATWFVGPYLGLGLLSVWILISAQRLLLSLVLSFIWYRRDWIHIKI